jgi:hypothetical protein
VGVFKTLVWLLRVLLFEVPCALPLKLVWSLASSVGKAAVAAVMPPPPRPRGMHRSLTKQIVKVADNSTTTTKTATAKMTMAKTTKTAAAETTTTTTTTTVLAQKLSALAAATQGFSGREIHKLFLSIQVRLRHCCCCCCCCWTGSHVNVSLSLWLSNYVHRYHFPKRCHRGLCSAATTVC